MRPPVPGETPGPLLLLLLLLSSTLKLEWDWDVLGDTGPPNLYY